MLTKCVADNRRADAAVKAIVAALRSIGHKVEADEPAMCDELQTEGVCYITTDSTNEDHSHFWTFTHSSNAVSVQVEGGELSGHTTSVVFFKIRDRMDTLLGTRHELWCREAAEVLGIGPLVLDDSTSAPEVSINDQDPGSQWVYGKDHPNAWLLMRVRLQKKLDECIERGKRAAKFKKGRK